MTDWFWPKFAVSGLLLKNGLNHSGCDQRLKFHRRVNEDEVDDKTLTVQKGILKTPFWLLFWSTFSRTCWSKQNMLILIFVSIYFFDQKKSDRLSMGFLSGCVHIFDVSFGLRSLFHPPHWDDPNRKITESHPEKIIKPCVTHFSVGFPVPLVSHP